LMMGGQSSSGSNFNVVPAVCSFTIDRRINPEEDFETEKNRLLDVLRSTGIEVEIETLQEGVAAGTPDDSPAAQALAAAVGEITGREPRFELCPGLLETRFYASRGIPAFA